MKLELKHLTPYLPYNVMIHSKYKNSDSFSTFEINYKNYNSVLTNDSRKLILRPLSDLVKNIEINGDNFIPLFHFAKMQIADDELDRLYIETDNKTFFNCMYHTGSEDDDLVVYFDSYNILLTPYERITELLKMHFDVFGLIDKGLAIDINTLKP